MVGISRKQAVEHKRRRRKRKRFIRKLSYLIFGTIIIAVVICMVVAFKYEEKKELLEETKDPKPIEIWKPQLIGSMDWDTNDSYLLAKIAMAEAECEDTKGKALVILVVLNRVWSSQFSGTIEEVITQTNAFGSYSNGRWEQVEPDADCWAALRLVMVEHWDESQGALYFERTSNESTWHSRNLERLFIHGNHTFYTEKEAKSP